MGARRIFAGGAHLGTIAPTFFWYALITSPLYSREDGGISAEFRFYETANKILNKL